MQSELEVPSCRSLQRQRQRDRDAVAVQKALNWIDKALALVPEYPEALQDRQVVVEYGYIYDAGSDGGAGMNRFAEIVLR